MLTQGTRLCSPTHGWGENPNFGKLQKALAVLGCATVAAGAGFVLYNFIQSEEQAAEFETRIAPIIASIQREEDFHERKQLVVFGLKEMRDYWSKYTIESGAMDAVFLGTMYHVLGKKEESN